MAASIGLRCYRCSEVNWYPAGTRVRRGCDQCGADWFTVAAEAPTVAPGDEAAGYQHFADALIHLAQSLPHLTPAERAPILRLMAATANYMATPKVTVDIVTEETDPERLGEAVGAEIGRALREKRY